MNQELIRELTLEEVNVAIPLLVKMQSTPTTPRHGWACHKFLSGQH